MKGKLTVEVDERGLHVECNLVKVGDYDKAFLLYHIGNVLEVDAINFSAIGELMERGIDEFIFANGETMRIDLSNIPNRENGGEPDV